MRNFSESERHCQMSFSMCGEVYHAYTSGREMPVLLTSVDDLAFTMNVIAYAAFTFRDAIKIVAFAVMNNHFHFVLAGSRTDISDFFRFIVKKLKRTIPGAGEMTLYFKPISDLGAMRNNIVYTNRNGYVANPDHTPFSYPWGTGRYYFNEIPSSATFADIGYNQNRTIFRGANVHLPADWPMEYEHDGSSSAVYVAPGSYCAISLGMAMFRDAHQYFAMVSKNVEAYAGIAVDLDDGEFLTDQELFAEVLKILRSKYAGARVSDLSGAQKLDIVRTLHYDYRSSNGQIRRVLGIGQYDVDQMFKTH